MPTELGETCRPLGVVDDAAVVRSGDSQRAFEQLVRRTRRELFQRDEIRTQLRQPIPRDDEDPVPAGPRQQWPYLLRRGRVVGEYEHRVPLGE